MERPAVKVLLIEDNPSDALLLRSAFEGDRLNRFVLTHVERLSEGLQHLARADFDVVLIDLNLPDSSGLETFERLHREAPELPVVVFSGNADEEDAIRAVQAGAQDYLVKGLGGFDSVPRTIRYAIERQKLGKSLRDSEVLLRAALTNAPITIFAVDHKGLFTLSEGKGLERVGLKPGENVGASAFDLYAQLPFVEHTGGVVLGQEVLRRALAGETVNAVNGLRGVYFDNYIGPLRDAEGNVNGVVGVATDITERRRAELEQHASLEIVQGLAFSKNMEEFISLAHASIRRVLQADNFFVALHDAASGNFQQVYWVDQYDTPLPPSKWEKTLTSYIFRTRLPVLFDRERFDQLLESGEVEWVGTRPLSLLGVPLIASGEVIGVLVLQDYHQADLYSERDLQFLTSIAGQVAQAVQRKRAEEALRASEERFRALIENGLDFISLLDERGNLLWESPSATQILGYRFNEFLGQNLFDLIHPDDVEETRKNFAELAREPGGHRPGVFRLKRADGAWRWVEAIGSNFLHLPGVGAIVINYRDITDRRRAEEDLRQSEARYRQLFEDNPHPMWVYDLETLRFLAVNDSALIHYGYSREEFLNMSIADIRPSEDWPRLYEMVASITDGVNKAGIWKHIKKDGSLIDVEITWHPMEFDGHRSGITLAQDVTERRKAEEALRQAEEKYRNIFENAMEAITQTTPDGRYLTANPAAARILGYDSTEELVAHVTEIERQLYVNPRRRDEFITLMEENGRITNFESEVYRKDGTTVWISENSRTVRDELGNLLYYEGSAEDITARKQTENKLNRRVSELEAIYENGLQINRMMEPRDIGERLIRTLSEKLEWHHVTVRLYSPESNSLDVLAFSIPGGDREANLNRLNQAIRHPMQGLSGWAFTHGEAVRCSNVQEDARYLETYPGIQSGMYVPLRVGERIIGVVAVESELEDAFTEDDEHLLTTLCNQTAVAIYNARLFFELQSELIERRLVEEQIRQFNVDLEKRVAERTAEIETTRQRLKLATSAGEIGVWEYLPSEDYLYWDNQVCLMYGVAPLENANAEDLWVNMLHPEDREAALQRHQTALEGEARYFSEYRILRSDGTVRHIVSQAIILRDEAGRAERMVGVNMDVTDQKRAEEALRLVNMEMERALRLKDEFLASMSHELRTPLNAILGISESLAEQVIGPLNPKQQKYIQTVMESGQHLLELINDILDLAKINAGKVEMDMNKVNVPQMVQSSLRMVREMAQKKEQELSLDIDKTVTMIWGDERRLKQMLVNLLSNAVKFTPQGGRIGLEVRGDAKAMILNFTVWDTGIGIDSKDLHLLFQPFVQLDSSLARSAQGTGLGLMLVSQMARLHGGSVSVQSEPGKGSRFTISIPWVAGTQTGPLNPAKLAPVAPPLSRENGTQATILLVEDTRAVSMLISDYLRHHGYNVLVAWNGFEGISQARQFHPDLILMDVMMPEMDGLETTRRIRAEPGLARVPIVALTALAMPGDRERCLEAGMNGYLSKPIQNLELLQEIEKYLSYGEEGNNNA